MSKPPSTVRLSHLYGMRAHIDALIMEEEMFFAEANAYTDPAEACPKCGAAGETQLDTSTMDGSKKRYCTRCQSHRVVNAVSVS